MGLVLAVIMAWSWLHILARLELHWQAAYLVSILGGGGPWLCWDWFVTQLGLITTMLGLWLSWLGVVISGWVSWLAAQGWHLGWLVGLAVQLVLV